MASSFHLDFTVKRQTPELLPPAEPTPYEWKEVSDIDDQDGLRYHLKGFFVFPGQYIPANKASTDFAQVIRHGLSRALVYFYPFAGRLREGRNRKLSVECTGQGILFCEADADVRVDQLGTGGEDILPPFPGIDKLFLDVVDVVGGPLFGAQLTRFACGGCIFSAWYNHVIADGPGYNMFLATATELARGAASPSLVPVWGRERLRSRTPARVTFHHAEYTLYKDISLTDEVWVNGSVVFTGDDEAALRAQLPAELLKSVSSFDMIAACLWRCRTVALQIAPGEASILLTVVNSRRMFNPPIAQGYYGNCLMLPAAVSEARKLVDSELSYAVELVKEAKGRVTEEYAKSTIDYLALNGRVHHVRKNAFLLSDIRRGMDFAGMDWGWGKSTYTGSAEPVGKLMSFVIGFKSISGDKRLLVPMCLPESAMERFKDEIKKMVSFGQSENKRSGRGHHTLSRI